MFIFVKRNISNENGQIIIKIKLSHEYFIANGNIIMIVCRIEFIDTQNITIFENFYAKTSDF